MGKRKLKKSRTGPLSKRRATKSLKRNLKRITTADIHKHIDSKSHDELVDRLMQICERDPDVRKALADECALSKGNFGELASQARAEIRSLTSEDAWYNPWKGSGHLPDYGGLEKRLKTLLDHGQADVVVELGEELLRCGIEQVGSSHDEGETAMAIGACMDTVARALMTSSRADKEKIIYAIDALLKDDYGICEAVFDSVLKHRWKKSAWSAVADQLQKRLSKQPTVEKSDEWAGSYQREQLSNWVMDSLDKAGRSEEATELCVNEAHKAGSYTRAVKRLIEEKQFEQAGELAQEGLDLTSPTYAGIIHQLQDQLCQIAAKRKDWSLPAAVAADRFFSRPSVLGYRELLKAAKKAKCEPAVQRHALAFLEKGKRPDTKQSGRTKGKSIAAWPLPAPPRPKEQPKPAHPAYTHQGPHFSVLIEMAIDEKRPEDVLKWYDERNAYSKRGTSRRYFNPSPGNASIAKAIESSCPERAIEIYQHLVEAIAAETNPKKYSEAGKYLKRIKLLLKKAGRANNWEELLDEFRVKHRRKRRLMEVLDKL